jgi:muramoyltetrapeptide carboxypeptidase
MRKPRALRAGDRVAVVAPASAFKRDEFDAGVSELASLGFEPVYDESVFRREWYVAGTADLRANAIAAAWRDPSIAAVIGVRGGYGSVQVLPQLDPALARESRKAFIGYSDLTSLLIFLIQKSQLVAFHGPMLAGRLGKGAEGYDRASFLNALTRCEPLGELAPAGLETVNRGEARGIVVGGTLTQIVSSLGTPFAFDPPAGHILFVDEVNERPYRLDRMMTQLRLSGILGRAAAVVFGELPSCDEPGGEPGARVVVADLMRDFPGPVLFGLPSGHTIGPAITLPMGVAGHVIADGAPRLIIEEAAVTRD